MSDFHCAQAERCDGIAESLPIKPARAPAQGTSRDSNAPQNKAHRLLSVLDGLTREQALTSHEIGLCAGLSTADMGRITNRLVQEGRLSRYKKDNTRSARFYYWMNPAQQKHFRALAKGAKMGRKNPLPVYGSDELDAMAQLGVRLITAGKEIKEEKERLLQAIEQLEVQLQMSKEDLAGVRARHRALRRALGSATHRLNAAQVELEKDERSHHGKALTVKYEAVKTAPGLHNLHPADLAERLRFVQKLRERPALADMKLLAQIEQDYMWALNASRGKD